MDSSDSIQGPVAGDVGIAMIFLNSIGKEFS